MKRAYIAILVALLLLVVGCKQTPEAAPVAPIAPVVPEVVAPAEPAPAPVLDADQATIDRYKAACEAGNMGLCAALKSKYGIEMSPAPKTTQ